MIERTKPIGLPDWLAVLVVAVAAFILFTATGSWMHAGSTDYRPADTGTVVVRLVTCLLLAIVLLVAQRRQQPDSWAAITEGIQVAAVIVVVTNLVSFGDAKTFAIRTAMVVFGLPALNLLMLYVSRRKRSAASENAQKGEA